MALSQKDLDRLADMSNSPFLVNPYTEARRQEYRNDPTRATAIAGQAYLWVGIFLGGMIGFNLLLHAFGLNLADLVLCALTGGRLP